MPSIKLTRDELERIKEHVAESRRRVEGFSETSYGWSFNYSMDEIEQSIDTKLGIEQPQEESWYEKMSSGCGDG